MSGEKILVIDDRRENLLFLANTVLRPEGYNVITALDGKEGLSKALAERPHLIITDLKMPRLSGLEMMAALRQQDVDIPVILTTFYGSEQAAIEAFRLGAKDYLVKPYEVAEMLKSVERALVEQRLRRETQGLKEGVQVSQQFEERVRQLHSLCGIAKALMAIHDSREVMRVAVEAALYSTGAAGGQLFLVNVQSRQLEVRAVRGPSDTKAKSLRQAGTDPVAQRVMESGQGVITERDAGGPDKVACVAVPLRSGAQVAGVLCVDAKPNRSFGENERYAMGLLADFVTVALTNARTIEQLKSQMPTEVVSEQPSHPSEQDLSEFIAGTERLAGELKDLSSVAEILAAGLQTYLQES
ncbi:MAG: response regulator [Anaerolineae bacterium]|jgi:two-component system NtrC family sensor kinase